MIVLSQRDKRWGDEYLGKSKSKVSRYGCTVVSIAMGSQFFTPYKDPAYLAKNLQFTGDGLLLWGSLPSCTAFSLETRFYGQRDDLIKAAIKAPDKIVLIQVENYHWVLGLGSALLGGYRIADPWFGDTSTTKRYKYISGGAILKVGKQGEPPKVECTKCCPLHCKK